MKNAPGYASLPARSLGERRIDRKQALPMSPPLRWAIVVCNRAHPAPSALRASNGSGARDCALEATRTQVFSVGDSITPPNFVTGTGWDTRKHHVEFAREFAKAYLAANSPKQGQPARLMSSY